MTIILIIITFNLRITKDMKLQSKSAVHNLQTQLTFISNVAGILTVFLLYDGLQMMINLRPHLHGFLEVLRPYGQDHELLHGQLIPGVASAVDDVERRNRKDDVVISGQLGNVPIERYALFGGAGLANGEGDAENGIGAELGLVLGSVQLQHEFVNSRLVGHVEILGDQRRADVSVYVLDRHEDT